MLKRSLTPAEKQAAAQATYGYGPITLRREGDYAIVEVEHEGRMVEVIRENLDGNFCHSIMPMGIADCIKRVPS